MTQEQNSSRRTDRESMDCDVLIIGGGPAGLAAAIRLMQLAQEADRELSVCVLEKGSEPGAHILSGAVMDPVSLDELLPGWEKEAPAGAEVSGESFKFLSEKGSFGFPQFMMPEAMNNHGNRVLSLGRLVRWMAEKAEELGVETFAGFAATEILYGENGEVIGAATGDMGLNKDGTPSKRFEPGIEILAKYTFFAEGARGQLSRELIERFSLDAGRDPQSYAIGIKEVWKVSGSEYRPGFVMHTARWPLDTATYGGSFVYHMDRNEVAVGFTVGLGYTNPHLSPFEEFQRFKTHPLIAKLLSGGERLSYGARAICAGGIQALPELEVAGGVLVGCAAGFMNGARIKGIHCAMKSGMLAAEAAFEAISQGRERDKLTGFTERFKASWLYAELNRARNFKPMMSGNLYVGTVLFGMDQVLFRGHAPFTLHRKTPDHATLKDASSAAKPVYGKKDTKLTFDMPSSVYLSGTAHDENQPVHLTLKDETVPVKVNYARYGGPEAKYCPAGVYEYVTAADGSVTLRINASNCLHCKTCDIKDPTQNIVWKAPQGGEGPNYTNM